MSLLSCAGSCVALLATQIPGAPHGSEKPSVKTSKALPAEPYRNYGTESATLPAGLTRVRLIHRSYWGSTGFDGDARRDAPGISVRVQASALAIDHGLTRRLSIGLGLPYVYENAASFSGTGFATSGSFQSYYAEYEKMFVERLIAQGECLNANVCHARIARGDGLPVAVDFRVPSTNEKVTIPAQVSIRSALTSLVTRGAAQRAGAAGWGDLEMGLRFRVSDFSPRRPYQTSLGLTLLAPTGGFTQVARAHRAPGRGLWELHASAAADARLGGFAVASLSGEGFVAPGSTRKRHSLARDGSVLATGRCDSAGVGNNWDGLCRPAARDAKFERAGLGWRALAGASADLEPVGLTLFAASGSLRFERDLAERLDGVESPAKWLVTASGVLGFDGIKLLIPVQFELEYARPLAGQHAVVAPAMLNSTLKVFF